MRTCFTCKNEFDSEQFEGPGNHYYRNCKECRRTIARDRLKGRKATWTKKRVLQRYKEEKTEYDAKERSLEDMTADMNKMLDDKIEQMRM